MEDLNKNNVQTLSHILIESRQELKQMQEEADELRETHHDKVYEKAAELQNKDKMTVIKEMKEREKQSRMYKKISFVLAPQRYQAITRLGIPKGMMQATTKEIWDFLQAKEKTNDKIEWEYTEQEQEIEYRLREWNILHFNQSIGTPLASTEWEANLSPDSVIDSNIVDVIHKAIEADSTLHPDSICLLQEMQNKITKPMPPEKTTVSLEEFQSFFKHTPEDRSSSPRGLHLGHYKSASYSSELSSILWNIAVLALENKHPLQ